ncbi:hypothetical protein SAMN02745121_06670 [Nannocystis exedens]|uniref:Uncharacterized protein n=1 Tax=Nannocystis exedens TaxID=54 RepID=A0A1I2FGK8_9BACT|nr:hypothetical protein [Nannocystis exedens]PCC70422.1 hypothetical protein NAEX_03465 [Nannocystis exedens]SFF04542.1 hypothetical protein SAMN02745121_06670 [Nannocystis exedens]
MPAEAAPRLRESTLQLLRRAVGRPAHWRDKLGRLAVALRGWADSRAVDRRLQHLHALGRLEAPLPTAIQRMVGAIDMLRFFLVPCAATYYSQKNIHFGFHTLLRALEDPASMIDPLGLHSARDTVIHHLLQVVHANPDYDLQLLESFPDGLDRLEAELEALRAGTHARAAELAATVEDADYHPRLLARLRAFRRRVATPLLCDEVLSDPRYMQLERVFGDLTSTMRYFSRLPATPRGALHHLLTVRTFPAHLAG